MDHEAFEKHMIDTVNRHAGEKSGKAKVDALKGKVFTKMDYAAIKRGLRHMAIAMLTAAMFAGSVCCLVAVATATGYWAVVLFLLATVLMLLTFILLYAQGFISLESKGDSK